MRINKDSTQYHSITIVCLTLVIFGIFGCSVSHAEDFVQSNLIVRPHLKSGTIKMVSETVNIRLVAKGVMVHAVYQLENPSQYNEYVRLGLPTPKEGDLRDLQVIQDETPLLVRYWQDEIVVVHESLGYDYSEMIPVYWALWDMDIDPGRQHTLVVDYLVPLQNGTGQQTRFHEEATHESQENNQPLTPACESALSQLKPLSLSYGVSEKSGWKYKPLATTIFFTPGMGQERFEWDKGSLDRGESVHISSVLSPSSQSALDGIKQCLSKNPSSSVLKSILWQFGRGPHLQKKPLMADTQGDR